MSISKNNKVFRYTPNMETILTYAIEATEKTNLTAKEKKQYCLKIILETINGLPSGKNKLFLKSVYDEGAFNDMIDIVCDASKGKLNINKKVNLLLKCLLSCFKKEQE